MLRKIYDAILQACFPTVNALLGIFRSLWALKDTRFGKLIGWSSVAGTISYVSAVFWAGISPALAFFRQVASDPSVAFTGLPQDGVLSLSWFWGYCTSLVPEALRWLLWFIGADWWVWLATSALALWFAGWLLSKVGQWMGAIVERVCQLL